MATATSSLEDLVTCPVCYEVYINPQSLGCLHVFCAACVHKLTVNNRLECPECRQITKSANIKSDFNKQSLVDLYLKHQEESEVARDGEEFRRAMEGCSIAGMKCQGCKKSKPVQYECRECKKLMCADCESAHQYFPVTMKHNVSSLEGIIINVKSDMNQILKTLKKTDEVLTMKIDFEKEFIQELQTIEARTVKEVNQHRKNLKRNIDRHHDDEIAKFKDSISKISQAGLFRKTMYESQIEAVAASVSLIDDVLKTSDISTLLKHREDNSIQTEMQEMRKCLDGIVVDAIPNVKVTRPQWNVSNCTKITVEGSMESGEPVNMVNATVKVINECCVPKTSTPKLTINQTQKNGQIPCDPKQQQLQLYKKDYSVLLDSKVKFSQRKEVELPYVPKRMLQVGDQIWCCGVNDNGDDNGLYIYDTDCSLMKYTPMSNIESITAIAYDDLHSNIIASYSDPDIGLYQISHNHGTPQRRILHKGSFSDVVMYNGDLYALNCNQNSVIVFKYTDRACMWTVLNSYTLNLNIDECFSLGICENDLYVCSYDKNVLLKLNQNGEMKQKYGFYKDAGDEYTRLWNPTLCSVDESGNMLVATKEHLYLGSKHDKWSTVNLVGEYHGWVKDALVDSGGHNVWICCTNFHGDWRLRKYSKS